MDTHRFKQKLQEEQTKVETELSSVGVEDPRNPGEWETKETEMDVMSAAADPNEAADKQEEYESNRSIKEALQVRHDNIKRALEKIENGTYGVCEVGAEQIEEDRLDANPAARTCKAHLEEEGSLLA